MIFFVLGFAAFTQSESPPSDWTLETSLDIKGRHLERWSLQGNEDIFRIIAKTHDGHEWKEVVLEETSPERSQPLHRGKPKRLFFADTFEETSTTCQAYAQIALPNLFHDEWLFPLDDLACLPFAPHPRHGGFVQRPRLEWASVFWPEHSDLLCNPDDLCFWTFSPQEKERLDLQIAGALRLGHSFLERSQVSLMQKRIAITSFKDIGNRSYYDAEQRYLVFGGGHLPDALDGTIVVHEWTHSLVDDVNPRLWGEQSEVLHEAIADFMAASLWRKPCIGAFDAHDQALDHELSSWPNSFQMPQKDESLCLRNLSSNQKWEQGMTSPRRMRDGALVVAAALYAVQETRAENRESIHLRRLWSEGLLGAILFESLLRLPKRILVHDLWAKMISVAEEQKEVALKSALIAEGTERKIWSPIEGTP